MHHTLAFTAALTERAAKNDARSIDVIASTDAIDSYDEIVSQKWDLSRYLANPVVLYSHESHELPIGRAENVRVEDGKLLATLTIATGTERAEEVWNLVQQGMLKGVSVGFRPHTTRWEKRDGREVLVLDDNELLEISITPIPANPEALAQLRARALGGRPAPTEKRMKNVMLALGLGADADEAAAVQVATQLRQLCAAAGKETPTEAYGAIEGLKIKASRCDVLAAEVETLRAADERRAREDLIKSAKEAGKVAPGNDKLEALLRSLPLVAAKECVEALPVVVKKQAERTPATKKTAPSLRFGSALGVTEEQLAESEKALAARGRSRDEE